ncbi:MAG: DUF1926 domain-containing protein [Candidatus Omnitrophica bacterium]|nr:DUF1926 domain-containing protein [Candidatus Omnitrophota bacterium]
MRSPAKPFIFCVHAHQPVGNFEHVFLEAYEKSYRPFFEVLGKHPAVKVSCHLSGSLLDWLEKNKPEFIGKLRALFSRGQIEFLGGGYYEPIYGMIPRKDLAGQIHLMRERLVSLFGVDPEGAWLTERVWDPELVRPLSQAGVAYTILDDFHFEKAGIHAPVTHYYRSEDGKEGLDLFASSKDLRYLMPFRKAKEAIDLIRSAETAGENVVVFADDCEKFGLWPGTHRWVYEEGWLDEFFRLLEADDSIEIVSFKEIRRRFRPERTVRIPHASYTEMMEWSGGRFYNFFEKYPESLYMKNRMWQVSRKVQEMPSRNGSGHDREEAVRALYRAECNCGYWHGVFGGLYLHHLRAAVFENLIEAEKRIETGGARARAEKIDSGRRWVLRQKDAAWFFNAECGGALEELDYLPKSANLLCNLRRQAEPYHRALNRAAAVSAGAGTAAEPLSIHDMLGAKESGLEQHLYYDPYRRLSFMDHFFEEVIDGETFQKAAYREIGDFVDRRYQASIKKDKGASAIFFERKGFIRTGDRRIPLTVKKTAAPRGRSGIRVTYRIRNEGRENVRFVFAPEFNFSIGETAAAKGLSEKDVREWTLHDSWRQIPIRIQSAAPAHLLAAAVETVSGSEGGMEKNFQELGVLLQRPLLLKPKQTGIETFELTVGQP